MLQSNKAVTIFWYRRDLRIEDNHGLFEALVKNKNVLPIFIFDHTILNKLSNKEDKRVDFIYQALQNLQEKFIEHGSSLYVFNQNPIDAFKDLIGQFNIQSVYTNHDYEPYAIKRDHQISDFLKEQGIEFKSYKDQVIFEKNEILKSDQSPYTIFTPYSKPWKEKLHKEGIPIYPSENQLENLLKIDPIKFPGWDDIGFKKTGITIGQPNGLTKIIQDYHLTRNIPGINGTSRLSVHLRFGTVSIRKLVKIALQLNEQWLNELIWREFFMQILFHFPRVVENSFKTKYDSIEWRNNEKEFEAWCKGETGYPIVDAGMRELNETGLMHNRVRMIVASFLTKHLLIDWRWGEAYFSEKLLDYDLSANNGNWQWAAGTGCDSAPYFRIFNPYEQVKKFDPKLDYIRTWIQPFNDYLIPPIVEHTFARKRCLDAYKLALELK
jgi:deoxyribodipyrimidine photo-lyase